MNKSYKYIHEYLEEIVEALSKFKQRIDLDSEAAIRVTRLALGDGIRRFFATLQMIPHIKSDGNVPELVGKLGDTELTILANNMRFFLDSIVEVLKTLPPGKREEGLGFLFSFLRFIMDLGSLNRELYAQFLISANFRSFLSKLNRQAGDAVPDSTPQDIQALTRRLLSLSDADQNMMKEVILTLACTVRHLNKLATEKKLTAFILQDSTGFFMALTKPGLAERLTSFLDMSFLLEENSAKRLIRLEFKAWVSKAFEFETDGLKPLINSNNRDGLVQAYRYLFESIFIHSDIRSISYVLPEKVNSGGLRPEMIQKIMYYLMNADSAYLKLLLNDVKYALRKPNAPVSEAHKLAYLVLENAENTDDFTFVSMMKHWDSLLDEDMKLKPQERLYSSAKKFAAESEKMSAIHKTLSDQLDKHMTAPSNVVGNGILLVEAELGAD